MLKFTMSNVFLFISTLYGLNLFAVSSHQPSCSGNTLVLYGTVNNIKSRFATLVYNINTKFYILEVEKDIQIKNISSKDNEALGGVGRERVVYKKNPSSKQESYTIVLFSKVANKDYIYQSVPYDFKKNRGCVLNEKF